MSVDHNALLRSQVYKLLYLFFHYPDKDSEIFLGKEQGIDGFQVLQNTSLIEKASDLFTSFEKATLEDLQVGYVRLFDYRPQCPPYESSHRTDIERNHNLQALSEFYRKAGVECSTSFDLDHISVELEFMHFLTYHEGGATESGNGRKEVYLQYEKGFMESHLLRWLPDFCVCLDEKTDAPFFKALASLTKDFILQENDHINALFKDPK